MLILLLVLHLGSLGIHLRIGLLISGFHVLSVFLVLHSAHLAFAIPILPHFWKIIRKIFLCEGYHIVYLYGIIPSNPYKGGKVP